MDDRDNDWIEVTCPKSDVNIISLRKELDEKQLVGICEIITPDNDENLKFSILPEEENFLNKMIQRHARQEEINDEVMYTVPYSALCRACRRRLGLPE